MNYQNNTTHSFSLYRVLSILAVAVSMAGIESCSLNGERNAENPFSHVTLAGAGSTFANPIYSEMLSEYNRKTGLETSYQSIGSSAGIKKLLTKTVDFGASDAFLSNDDMMMFTSPVVEFPTCLGAVVLTYNLTGVTKLQLTPDVIADIYLGKITKWTDERIKAINKDITIPDLDIKVVHRADGSGTTYVFTDYLSKVSNDWRMKVGIAKSPTWPLGIGGNGNEGVAVIVKLTPGAIGYVELVYALQKYMNFAAIKNFSGKYIKASLESTSLAANVDIPDDTRISITDSPVEDAYPISSFTWIILYKEQFYNGRDRVHAEALLSELAWMIHKDGQKYTQPLNYGPLPPKAIAAAEGVLGSVTFQGVSLLSPN